jgi:hypothetical protein
MSFGGGISHAFQTSVHPHYCKGIGGKMSGNRSTQSRGAPSVSVEQENLSLSMQGKYEQPHQLMVLLALENSPNQLFSIFIPLLFCHGMEVAFRQSYPPSLQHHYPPPSLRPAQLCLAEMAIWMALAGRPRLAVLLMLLLLCSVSVSRAVY